MLLRPPQEANPADSATFQRLGMAATPSRLLEDARALESRLESARALSRRALTPPPASPPTTRETLLTSEVEVLAPSSPRGARLQVGFFKLWLDLFLVPGAAGGRQAERGEGAPVPQLPHHQASTGRNPTQLLVK